MSIAEKLQTIAENEQKVYNKGFQEGEAIGIPQGVEQGYEIGRQAEYDAFWDAIQAKGARTFYGMAFRQWGCQFVRPKYKVVPTEAGSARNTFFNNDKLKKVEAAYFDFSQMPRGTYLNNSWYYTFATCGSLEEIEDIGMMPDYDYTYTFAYCPTLRKIAKITLDENTVLASVFQGCRALTELTVDGTIGRNGFNVSWSTKLTHESLMSIINALADYSEDASGTAHTLTIGGTNKAKLTEDELGIAYAKGWDIV